MATIFTLTDREGEVIYPITAPQAIINEHGDDLNAMLTSPDTEMANGRLSLTDRAKRQVFDDMFLAAVGEHGKIDHTHIENGKPAPYYLNKLWLTYEEAVAVMNLSTPKDGVTLYSFGQQTTARTNLPMPPRWVAYSTSFLFYGSNSLEIARFSGIVGTFGFCRCRKLHTIIGTLYSAKNGAFDICPMLESLNYRIVSGESVSFASSPKLNYNSLRWTVNDVSSVLAKTATIIVHPDVYAKLTDETNAEWSKLMTDALAKNIVFATV